MRLLKKLFTSIIDTVFGLVKWTLIILGVLYLYELGILEWCCNNVIEYLTDIFNK